MAILDVQHIEKHFGDTSVLKDISFSLEEGQALSIIGSSGSGKTTLLRCLNFLETPDQGVISVRGKTLFDAADPVRRTFARSGCTSVWCSRASTCSPSIRRWKTWCWPGS